MKVLFLDDNYSRVQLARACFDGDDLQVCMNAESTIEVLRMGFQWDLVMLDHDLGGIQNGWQAGNESTGMDVVDYIVADKPSIKRIVIHSHNHPAAERMEYKLRDIGYNVARKPFAIVQ